MKPAPADLQWQFESALPHTLWPAMPAAAAATTLSLLQQLEQTQWLPAARLRELQERQLELLVRHATSTVPYYRGKSFSTLPILTRRELQDRFGELRSERYAPEHGVAAEVRSSGSTGAPVRVLRTQVSQLFWDAITLRDHAWHRRHLEGKLAAIRHGEAARSSTWGRATAGIVKTGPAVRLAMGADVEAQLAQLGEEQPDYLITYPSNAAALARAALAKRTRLAHLREVRTMGEALHEDTRGLCREAWQAPVVDVYSAEEVGYIALQCPEHEHYHVQSESLLVEVLDEQGDPCAAGQTGRVVVTDLHNYAMPLLRYEIGDYAEVGPPCPCGRGLPVLSRIAGRVRNMLVASDGKRYFPFFGTRSMPGLDVLRQHQFVQKSPNLVEARLVVAAPFSAGQERAMREHVLSRLPAGFEVRFVYVDRIARSPSGKFEDFVSELQAPRR